MNIAKKPDEFFNKNEVNYLRNVHYFLNKMYYNRMFGTEELSIEKIDVNDLKKLEAMWIGFEKSECMKRYDCHQVIRDIHVVEVALKNHPVYQHRLFNYLKKEADIHDLRTYILHESVLNLEFFDYLALSVVGVSDEAKSEIIANLWDEAGRGNIQHFHTTMFNKLMKGLGLHYDRQHIIDNMSWEALSGINLFSYFSLYPQHKIKYFGLLAATEMLDPPHYHQLVAGIQRILKNENIDHTYYEEHALIDIEHANGWLKKVILPELTKNPAKTHEFWLGFYMRLESVERYYHYLINLFSANCAA